MDDPIEILLAEATASCARLYVRGSCKDRRISGLAGSLHGPQCRYGRTLPSSFSLHSVDSAAGQLAELVIPEPCYWTPERPLVYRLDLQWQDSAGQSHKITRLVGIRRWGVERTAWRLEGRRTVLRGMDVGPRGLDPRQLATAHDGQLTLIVHQLDDTFCEAASRIGVALVANLRGAGDRAALACALDRACRWPAVLAVVVSEHQVAPGQALPAGLPMLQLLDTTARETGPEIASEIKPWATGVWVETDGPRRLPDGLATIDKPILVIRRSQQEVNLATVRGNCDRLQADLAPRFDLAGYFVGE